MGRHKARSPIWSQTQDHHRACNQTQSKRHVYFSKPSSKKHGKTVWEVEVVGGRRTVTGAHRRPDGTVIDTEQERRGKNKREEGNSARTYGEELKLNIMTCSRPVRAPARAMRKPWVYRRDLARPIIGFSNALDRGHAVQLPPSPFSERFKAHPRRPVERPSNTTHRRLHSSRWYRRHEASLISREVIATLSIWSPVICSTPGRVVRLRQNLPGTVLALARLNLPR